MKIITTKEDREKVINKMLKQIKSKVKNVEAEDNGNELSQACLEASTILFEYLLKSVVVDNDNME